MSLFPSANAIQYADLKAAKHDEETDLNWLCNASFASKTKTIGQLLKPVVTSKEETSTNVWELQEDRESSSDSSSSKSEDCTRHARSNNKKEKYSDNRKLNSYKDRHRKRAKRGDTDSGSDRSQDADHGERRKRKKKRHKKEHRSSKRHGEKKGSMHQHKEDKTRDVPSDKAYRTQSIWIDEHTHPTPQGFYFDTKPDRNNLCFDSLHHTNLAFYKKLGKTFLGITPRLQLLWNERDKDKKKRLKTVSHEGRYFTSLKTSEDVLSFVPGISEGQSNVKDSSFGQTAPEFLSLQRKKEGGDLKRPSGSNPIEDEVPLDEINHERWFNPILQKVADFNNHLQQNPHDIEKWAEFCQFQDQFMGLSQENTSKRSKRLDLLVVEKKLSILEKALSHNPKSVDLQMMKIEICRDLWEVPRVQELVDKLCNDNKNNPSVIKYYLKYHQSSYSSFSVSSVAELYRECISSLREFIETPSEQRMQLQIVLIELFLRLCFFWHQAGHTEKALTAFQAMIEFNIFCPSSLKETTSLSAQLAFLETFWDSEEPKVGEPGSKGWDHWMRMKERGGWVQTGPRESSEDVNDDDLHISTSMPKAQIWMQEELRREHHQCTPWHPDTSKGEKDEDCEDPDRIVLFDDIGKVLFKLDSDEQKFHLVLHFLSFLGVSCAPLISSNNDLSDLFFETMLDHPFELGIKDLTLSLLNGSSFCTKWDQVLGVELYRQTPWTGRCHGPNRSDLTLDENSYTLDPLVFEQGSKRVSKLINNIVSQVSGYFSGAIRDQLTLLQLRHHLCAGSVPSDSQQMKKHLKDCRKFAKKTLSNEGDRKKLNLWNTFASWEWSIGNVKEAERIYESAFSFASNPQTDEEKRTYAQAIHTYCFLTLGIAADEEPSRSSPSFPIDTGRRGEALNVLTTLGEMSKFFQVSRYPEQTVSSSRILKARKLYLEQLDEAKRLYSPIVGPELETGSSNVALEPDGSYLFHLAACFGLFQYLSVSIQAASVAFEEVLSFLEQVPDFKSSDALSQSPQCILDHEMLMTFYVRLVYFHVSSNPVPVKILRSLLHWALNLYPNNFYLLQLLIQCESKSHIAGHVRRFFDEALLHAESPVCWFAAIFAEMKRLRALNNMKTVPQERAEILPDIGITHRIRSLFQRASESKYVRHSVLLWRLYMNFEIQQGNLKNAKAVFYNALQHCPWAKSLYMDLIEYFPESLEETIDLMMEKEIRIRVPLEEIDLLVTSIQTKRESSSTAT